MTLTAGGTNLVTNESINQVSLDSGSLKFTDETATGPIPTPSINQDIHLTSLFTTDTGSLQYRINVTKVSIDPSQTDKTIIAELLIKLPLEFTVSGQASNPAYTNYVKLELGDVLPKSSDTGDLFGRTGKDDDLLKNLGDVTITLEHYTNTVITTPIALSIWDKKSNYSNKIEIKEGESPTLTIKADDLPYPFTPQYEILIPKDTGDAGTLTIGRLTEGAKLDFSLVVDAQATIDQTITF
jgi:hypothetical protein